MNFLSTPDQQDCPRFDMLAKHVRYVAGAAISAAEELAEGRADVVIVWDGGRYVRHLRLNTYHLLPQKTREHAR